MVWIAWMALCLGLNTAAGRTGSGVSRALVRLIVTLAAAAAGVVMGQALPWERLGRALAFAALCGTGGRMLLEALRPLEEPPSSDSIPWAAADALGMGFALAFLPVPLWKATAALCGAVVAAFLLPAAEQGNHREVLMRRVARWASAAGALGLTVVGGRILLEALL